MHTNVHVIGTIATDPKLITSSAGTKLCHFRLASDERRYDREQQTWVEGNTNWFGVNLFRALAENAHESFQKGDRVIVSGRLRIRSWQKDDRRGTAVDIEADAIGHDVRWGTSSFLKRQRTSSDAAEPSTPDAPAAGSEFPPASAEDAASPFAAQSPTRESSVPGSVAA